MLIRMTDAKAIMCPIFMVGAPGDPVSSRWRKTGIEMRVRGVAHGTFLPKFDRECQLHDGMVLSRSIPNRIPGRMTRATLQVIARIRAVIISWESFQWVPTGRASIREARYGARDHGISVC